MYLKENYFCFGNNFRMPEISDSFASPPVGFVRLCKEGQLEISDSLASPPVGFVRLCKEGQLQDALHTVACLQSRGQQVSLDMLTHLLQACVRKKDVLMSKQVYLLMNDDSEFELDVKLGCQLIRMFASCGTLLEARQVFDRIHLQNVFTWTAMISAYAQHGQSKQAMELYHQMRASSVTPSSHTFVAVLKVCSGMSALDQGKLIHMDVINHRLEQDLFVGSALIDMYARFGCLDVSHEVFNNLPKRDVVCWYAIISGYAKLGRIQEAFELYKEMQTEGIQPSNVTFTCLLNACGCAQAIDQGKLIHAETLQHRLETDLFVGSALVDMYCKCGGVNQAWEVFEKLSEKNVVTWSAMISGYAENGDGEKALQLFEEMQEDGIKPDSVTFISILKACSSLASLWKGILIHANIIERGMELDVYLGNTLVGMYAKWGSLDQACNEFCKLHKRDVVSWNAIIAGYVEHGHNQEAVQVFQKMQQEGPSPDNVTSMYILKACAALGDLAQGKLIHSKIQRTNLESDPYLGSAAVDMYAKCGSLDDACDVFKSLSAPDVVSWSTMIAAYVEHCCWEKALQTYKKMQQEGVKPDKVTLVWVLKACAGLVDLYSVQMAHRDVIDHGIKLDLNVCNTLVDVYAKCGSLKDAGRVFASLEERDVVTWNAMIAGTVEHGQSKAGLQLFERMQQEGIKPDSITFTCALQACSALAALGQGKLIHADAKKCGLDMDKFVGSSLVDMYAKCGSLEDARVVFDKLPECDIVSWSALIAGYAQHGHLKHALFYFDSMLQQGIKPDDVTFLSLLSAFSHAGLVKEGLWYFKSMMEDHGLSPTYQHYMCMIDLLARAGCLYEAEDFIMNMPFEPDTVIWMSLLGACAKFGNVELGQRAFDSLVKCDPQDAAPYRLLSNIYASSNVHE